MSEGMNRRFAHGGNVYDAKPGGGEWLDFSANINPLGLSPKVRQAIEAGIEHLVHYPDPAARALKQEIAERYGVPREEIVLGNGGAELFYVFFMPCDRSGCCFQFLPLVNTNGRLCRLERRLFIFR